METFIVRFYRRNLKSIHGVAGTVEHVGSGERTAFGSEYELLARLLSDAVAPVRLLSGGALAPRTKKPP
jgi:hypothetical protein